MKTNIKYFLAGFIICVAATCVYASSGIRYAAFNGNKVVYNGRLLNLNGRRLLSVAKERERHSSNYMPVRAVFEAMGFTVNWNAAQQVVEISGQPISMEQPVIIEQPQEDYYSSPPIDPQDIGRQEITVTAGEYKPTDVTETATAPIVTVSERTIPVPAGLTQREAESFKLMTEIMTNEMNTQSGITAVINIGRQTRTETEQEKKKLSEAMYDALSKVIEEGSKKVLRLIQTPGSGSSAAYTEAYNKFKSYVTELSSMLDYFNKGDLDNGNKSFDAAVKIYESF